MIQISIDSYLQKHFSVENVTIMTCWAVRKTILTTQCNGDSPERERFIEPVGDFDRDFERDFEHFLAVEGEKNHMTRV